MIRKSITVTGQQNEWIRSQIEAGHYGNDSEVIRELIRERQLRDADKGKELERIRAKLIKAEQSGFETVSAEGLLQEVKEEMRLNGDLQIKR